MVVTTSEQATTKAEAEVVPAAPYWAVLPLGQLEVDATYQRPLTDFVEEIVDDFDHMLVGVLCVSRRSSKKYAIVDGQTRAAAMNRLGMADAPCLVYEGLSVAKESRMFARFQTQRRGVHPATLFNAEVQGGDPNMVALNDVITGLGFRVAMNIQGPRDIRVPGTLKWVFRGCSLAKDAANVQDAATVARMLEIVEGAWPTLPDSAKSADMLKGVGLYLKKHPQIDDRKLIRKLKSHVPDDIMDRAKLLRRSKQSSGSGPKWLAEIIDDIYNSTAKGLIA